MSGRVLVERWSAQGTTQTVQETSSRITYRGSWYTARHASYLGGKVRSTDKAGAKAVLRFKGSAISWIGSVGPTRGKAKVYLDGKLVATVNTWAGSFRPARVLFQHSWDVAGSHRISIVAKGTAGHPTVAIDAFLVRVDGATDAAGARGRGKPSPKPIQSPDTKQAPADSPVPTAEPTPPASDPVPTPDVPAGATPAPTAAPAVAPTPAPPAADADANRRADTCSHQRARADGGANRRADTCPHRRAHADPAPARPSG